MSSRHIIHLLQCLSHILLQFSLVCHLRTHLQLLLNKKQMLIPPLSSMRKLAPVVVPGSRCQWCRSLGARCDPARVNIALAPHSSSSSSSSYPPGAQWSYRPPSRAHTPWRGLTENCQLPKSDSLGLCEEE